MEPFWLTIDTEPLDALEVYKGTLMEPVFLYQRGTCYHSTERATCTYIHVPE